MMHKAVTRDPAPDGPLRPAAGAAPAPAGHSPFHPPFAVAPLPPMVSAETMAARRCATAERRWRCMIVRQIAAELLAVSVERRLLRRDRRRLTCHARQIAMYVCHVALSLPLSEIGRTFGRDRTTVSHACAIVEDRRESPGFDALVAAVERLSVALFRDEELETADD